MRQHTDRSTNSVTLQYAGRVLDFHEYLYGYPDGTFFVVNRSEVPLPEDVEELAAEACMAAESLPDAEEIRLAVVDSIVSQALVDAPEILADMAEPDVQWLDSDRRLLERQHMIAAARAAERIRIAKAQLKIRIEQQRPEALCAPTYVGAPPPVAGWAEGWSVSDANEVPSDHQPAESDEGEQETSAEALEEAFEQVDGPASVTVRRAQAAIRAAREAELPQRLPGGARRRLKHFPPASYVIYGDAIEPRADLCAAMADGQGLGRSGREPAVVDWDGEWPVVVRRYGKEGRTVYRVEEALRRAGVEVEAA